MFIVWCEREHNSSARYESCKIWGESALPLKELAVASMAAASISIVSLRGSFTTASTFIQNLTSSLSKSPPSKDLPLSTTRIQLAPLIWSHHLLESLHRRVFRRASIQSLSTSAFWKPRRHERILLCFSGNYLKSTVVAATQNSRFTTTPTSWKG